MINNLNSTLPVVDDRGVMVRRFDFWTLDSLTTALAVNSFRVDSTPFSTLLFILSDREF